MRDPEEEIENELDVGKDPDDAAGAGYGNHATGYEQDDDNAGGDA